LSPRNAAAPGVETEGEVSSDLSGRLIGSHLTADVKLPDPRVFMTRDTVCPYSCSFSSSGCPFRCAPLSVRDSEVPS
jgi:hypothetical protein